VISAILLAAGASRRMGEQNKLLLPFRNNTLLGQVVTALCDSDAGEVVVVLGHEAEQVRVTLPDRPFRIVENPDFAQGMTTSIRAGVRMASPQSEGFMICLSDLPFVEPSDYNYLLNAFRKARVEDDHAIVRPVHQGCPGNPVLFSSEYRQLLLAHEKLEGCRGLIKQHPEHVRELEMATDHVLRDIDTPEQYGRQIRSQGV
jgi:molybdenum cofactor cytidylyltransferase